MESPFRITTAYWVCVAASASLAVGCGSSSETAKTSQVGGNSPELGSGGTTTTSKNSTGGTTAPPASTGGLAAASGSNGVGGSLQLAGGAATTAGLAATGGRRSGAGGVPAVGGRSGVGAGGASVAAGGTLPQAGANGTECTIGTWPAADPTAAGPFATVTDNNVGPTAGVGAAGAGSAPQFTMFRPKDMTQGALCHPVVTWGNGTSANPSMYRVLLNNLATHGFVVIASNSPNVLQGNPAPMIVGVTWVLEQNDDPSSVLYHRIDTTHIGATGHSQGAMATTQASADSHIMTSVPIEGASVQRNLHGPAMFFCGGQDTLVGCNGAQSAINAVTQIT